jgi:ABC-type hemin transport system ATPase subunit
MPKHSAEFLRGAVAALEEREYLSFQQCVKDRAQYAELLAQAEAREAAPDASAVIETCKEALDIARQQFASHAGEGQNEELCAQALSTIAAWEASNAK